MIGSGEPQNLAYWRTGVLAYWRRAAGSLRVTGDPFEPYQLVDPSGDVAGLTAAARREASADLNAIDLKAFGALTWDVTRCAR